MFGRTITSDTFVSSFSPVNLNFRLCFHYIIFIERLDYLTNCQEFQVVNVFFFALQYFQLELVRHSWDPNQMNKEQFVVRWTIFIFQNEESKDHKIYIEEDRSFGRNRIGFIFLKQQVSNLTSIIHPTINKKWWLFVYFFVFSLLN